MERKQKETGVDISKWERFAKFWANGTLRQSLLSPMVLTTLISVIAAPIVTGKINDQINHKNTQKEILTAMIESAQSTQLNKLEAIQQLQIIVSMVNENEDQFKIKLSETWNLLNKEAVNRTHILSNKLSVLEEDKRNFQEKIAADSVLLQKNAAQLRVLNNQRSTLMHNVSQNQNKLQKLDNEINNRELVISGLTEKDINNRKRLRDLDENLIRTKKRLETAEQELTDLLKQSDSLKSESNKFEQLLAGSETKAMEFRKALAKANEQLVESGEIINSLLKNYKDCQNENQELTNEIISLNRRLDEKNLKLNFTQLVPDRNLQVGSEGDEVGLLQNALVRLGYLESVDKKFGPNMIKTLINFQLDNDIDTSNIAGKYESLTRLKLLNQLETLETIKINEGQRNSSTN